MKQCLRTNFEESPDCSEQVWIGVLKFERRHVDGREVFEFRLEPVRVDLVAGAGVAGLPGNPGEDVLPRGSHPPLLRVYHVVGAAVGRGREDEYLYTGDG